MSERRRVGANDRRTLVVEADGGSRGNPGAAGYGAVVRDRATGEVLAERAGYLGVTTNNVAEYSGLIAGLRAAAGIDPGARVLVRMDSRLVVEQMSGRWQIRHDDMRRLADQARESFPGPDVTYEWVPRAQNTAADHLANEAMDSKAREIVRDYRTGALGPAGAAGARESPDVPAAADAAAGQSVRAGSHDEPALTLVLIRHGQTPMTAAGRFSGSTAPGPPLTASGRTQAARAADLVYRIGRDAWPDLPRVNAVVASPLVRAEETAAAVGRRLGVRVTTDTRFTEADFGEWEGLTAAEIDHGWPGRLAAWRTTGTVPTPGGESYADVGHRVGRGVRDLMELGLGRTVAVVGHAVPVRAAVGTALGAPPGTWWRIKVPPAALTVLRLWADGASELTASGVPGDLGSAGPPR